MKKKEFLTLLKNKNALSDIALQTLSQELKEHPNLAQHYFDTSKLKGNSKIYSLENLELELNELTGRQVLFLGTNMTFGFNSLGESFVDRLWKQFGLAAIKDVETNTLMINQDTHQKGDSYVHRLQSNFKNINPEVVVIELSPLDQKIGVELGQISEKHYDTSTIIGSLEYMISEIKLIWHAKIIIYSYPYFKDQDYNILVNEVRKLKEKWQFDFLNFYDSNKELDSLYTKGMYLTRAGQEKLLPQFYLKLKKVLTQDG